MGGWITKPNSKRKPQRTRKIDQWPGRDQRPIGQIDITRLPRSEYTPHPPQEKQDAR